MSRKARLTYGVRGSRRFDHNDPEHVCREDVSGTAAVGVFVCVNFVPFVEESPHTEGDRVGRALPLTHPLGFVSGVFITRKMQPPFTLIIIIIIYYLFMYFFLT